MIAVLESALKYESNSSSEFFLLKVGIRLLLNSTLIYLVVNNTVIAFNACTVNWKGRRTQLMIASLTDYSCAQHHCENKMQS